MTQRKVLTVTSDYNIGDLSFFPQELDTTDDLYETSNNALSILTGRFDLSSKNIYVNDNGKFPEKGVIRINEELIYYHTKSDKTFSDLIRGFNRSIAQNHSTGSLVLGCACSLHHNSVRDSIIKCEQKTGLISDEPDIDGTLTAKLKYLDIKWFTPTARIAAYPIRGRYPLKVNFYSFSLGEPYIDYEWDFGDEHSPLVNLDGTSNCPFSIEQNPSHVFYKPGAYTVTLTVNGYDGRKSFLKKLNYIEVFDDNTVYDVLAYARMPQGGPNEYQMLTFNKYGLPNYDNRLPLEIQFVDQTLGFIQGRKWNFGDGTIIERSSNSYDHIINHAYTEPGIYWPELQVLDQNNTFYTYSFRQPIVVGIDAAITNSQFIFGPTIHGSLTKPTFGQGKSLTSVEQERLQKAFII